MSNYPDDIEAGDDPTPEEEAEIRRLRLGLRASYGYPYAVEAFAKEPDIPDWLWRAVMRKATSNLFQQLPKRTRERLLNPHLRELRETRGRKRKLDDEFIAAFRKYCPSGRDATPEEEAAALKKAMDEHNKVVWADKAQRRRFVQDPRTAREAVRRATRSRLSKK